MEIKLIEGCLSCALTIDGKDEEDLTNEERKEVLERLSKAWEPEDLNDLLQVYVDMHGHFEVINDKPCECCGDIVTQQSAII